MLNLFVGFVGAGVVFVVLAIPLIRRRVPPNLLYGFRLPSTLRDRDLWYSVNRRTGWLLLCAGLAEIAVAIVLYPLHLKRQVYTQVLTAVLATGTLLMTVLSFLYLRQQRRD